MTNQVINPTNVLAPFGDYSHAVSTRGPGRTLYISGQLGIDERGSLSTTFAGQATQFWRNLVAILAADNMTVQDLVKVTTFVTDMSNAQYLRNIREPFLLGFRPASTLVEVSRLVMSEWLVELEAVAFKADRS